MTTQPNSARRPRSVQKLAPGAVDEHGVHTTPVPRTQFLSTSPSPEGGAKLTSRPGTRVLSDAGSRGNILTVVAVATILLGAFTGCPSRSAQPVNGGGSTVIHVGIERPTGPQTNPDARALLDDARARHAGGDYVGARAIYFTIIKRHGEALEARDALVEIAEDALKRADYAMVERVAAQIPDDGTVAALRARRDLTLARAFEARREYQRAAALYRVLLADRPVAESPARVGAARCLFLAGQTADAAALAGELELSPEPSATRERLARWVTPALANDLPTSRELLSVLPPSDPWRGYVGLAVARHDCAHARLQTCRDGALAAESASDDAWRDESKKLLAHVATWDVTTPQTLGVLLPLSGKYKRLGETAKQAIELALESFPNITPVFRDTKGVAKHSTEQATALIVEDHVVSVIGPIGRQETAAALEVTGAFGVPHLALSSYDAGAADHAASVRIRLTPSDKAAAIARYAVTELGVRRVGLLYPDNHAGRTLMGAFWREAERLGASVYAVESYASDENDFNKVIKRLLAADDPGTGYADMDALFIPDGARTVRRLVPFLKYWGVDVKTEPGTRAKGVQLLGADGWNHPSVVDRGDNLTDNAIFVDAFTHDPDDPSSDDFARRYFARHQTRARAFQAEVFDATGIVAKATAGAKGADHSTRLAVVEALHSTTNYRGATGLITVRADGLVRRRPKLLTIDLDDIRARLPEDEERATRAERFAPEPTE